MKRETWNIENFSKINLPQIIEEDVDLVWHSKDVRVLDMPIQFPGKPLSLPSEIVPFIDIIDAVFQNELNYFPIINNLYIYITIDQKQVKKGNTGRRAGAHADGYIDTETSQIDIISENVEIIRKEKSLITHTYIWHDCLPTEFFLKSFPLTDSTDEGSLRTFDEIADNCSKSEIITLDNKSLIFLTPYIIHRSAVAKEDTYRTFVKVSVSDKQFRRKGNTKNPLFNYDWKMEKRTPAERNTPWI